MSTNRKPPFNEQVERAILGAALLSDEACSVLATQLEPEDFYLPRHQTIVTHLHKLHKAGIKPEVRILADEISRSGEVGMVDPNYLSSLVADAGPFSTAPHYAGVIIDYAARRRLIGATQEILERAYEGNSSLDEILELGRKQYGSIDLPVLGGRPDLNVREFLNTGTDEYDWLVPGLLEKTDRLIITGSEGRGKSTLLRAMAVCTAAGLHPFKFTPEEPLKVLIVDVENNERQVRRKLRPLIDRADHVTGASFNDDNLRICVRLDGLDLMQRVDVRWLFERIEANRPDILMIGPMYKLHAGDPIDEGPARVVSRVLDVIRAKYGCAVIMEAHSPYTQSDGKRIGRPYGASLWSRWPEFGLCLAPDQANPEEVMLDPWRGGRDEREWPAVLRRGKMWPWEVSVAGNYKYKQENSPKPPVQEDL